MAEKLKAGTLGKLKNFMSIKAGVILAIIIILALLPLYGSNYAISVGLMVFAYMALGQMWNLLAGYSGLVSLGQQAFIGIGGYTLAKITVSYDGGFFLSFVVAIIVAAVFALIISFPIFKLSGVYFTIGTWIVSESVLVFCRNWEFVNFDAGINITKAYRLSMGGVYLGALALAVASVAVVWLILRSHLGLALLALRDDTAAAEARGVHLYRTKLICFLISSVFTAVTGVILYMSIAYVLPSSSFGIDWAVAMVFIVVIGGIGTIEGPIIGAVIYILLKQFLLNFPGMSLIILGVIAVAVIMLMPKGIMGMLNSKFGLRIFSVRRNPDE